MNITAVVVDASVWVSFYIPTDVNHQASVAWFVRYTLAGGYLVAPQLALAEVGAAAARRSGQPAVGHQAMSQMYLNPLLQLVSLDDMLVWNGGRLAATLLLRAGDALYVKVADQRKMYPVVKTGKGPLLR